jgi:hypothetical protein
MRSFLFVPMVLALVGCGDDGGSTVDAGPSDASVDASSALTGLGQRCVVAMQGADCPTNAPGCLSYVQGAAMGVCTNICVMDGTFMTNAQSQPDPASFMPNPTTRDSVCQGIYTGDASGVPSCSALTARTPTGALGPNMTYTFSLACEISCGAGNTCPGGLTCNTDPNIMACTP